MAEDSVGAFVPGPRAERAGASEGPLAGLRFAVKDLYDTAGDVTGYGNPDVDLLLNEAAGLSDRDARAVLYAQALAILARDVPTMVLFDELSTEVAAANLRGLRARLDQRDGLEFTWLAR